MPEDLGPAEDAALAAIVRSSPDAVVAKTLEGTITAWNRGAEDLYGHSAPAVLGRGIEVIYAPGWEQDERRLHAEVAGGEARSGVRLTRVRADGSPVEVVLSMLPVRDRDGRLQGVASISRAVSEQERAAERVADLLASAPDAILEVEPDGRVTLHNDRVLELFRRSEEELQALDAGELVPGLLDGPADDEGAARQETRLLEGVSGDGGRFPVEVSLVRTDAGTVVATIRDVTDQQLREADLRESETRLRQLAENVSTVFTLRQLHPSKYLYVSPGIEALTGNTPEDLYADPSLAMTVHPEDRTLFDRLREVSLPGAEGTASAELRVIHRSGQVRWVRAVTSLVPHASGVPQRVVGMVEDITERKLAAERLVEAEAEARAANEAKNMFLSRMSHELRTPLNAILGFGQLLELRLAGTGDGESVQHVLHAGRHLLALIDDVLDISRIEAGEMPLSLEPVDVAELVEESLRLVRPMAQEASVELGTLAPGGSSTWVRADAQRLRQVLLNLLSNAVKYNRRGGHVRVTWGARDDLVRIEVADDGPGIARSVRDRLFTPFDRLGAEQSSVEGTGVGLALSRALMELMAGTLDAEDRPGPGAVFAVTLPRSEPARTPPPEHAHRGDAAHHLPPGSRTLLYVEDNTANVSVMQAVLELRPEWQFVHAALGSLALDLARSHRPDLVLLDLHLPDGSGADVLSALRADPATAATPVVVVSADASRGTMRRVLEAGATDYLAKPYELEHLLEVLDAAATAAG